MAKSGRVPLLPRECGWCSTVFGVCRPCFRGQLYCGKRCRAQARTVGHRIANRKHQRTLEGREDHRDRQRELRKRQKEKAVTDQSCEDETGPRSLATTEERQRGHDQTDSGETIRDKYPEKPFCLVCRSPGFFLEPREGWHAQRRNRCGSPLQ